MNYPEAMVTISLKEYNELQNIKEEVSIVKILDDEDLSNALQSLFKGISPERIRNKYGIEIMMSKYEDNKPHEFPKKMIIKKIVKIKKDEENISANSGPLP